MPNETSKITLYEDSSDTVPILAIKIDTPKPPNFVSLSIPGGTHANVAVGELSDFQLEQLTVMWRKALFEVAARQRANPEPKIRHRGLL